MAYAAQSHDEEMVSATRAPFQSVPDTPLAVRRRECIPRRRWCAFVPLLQIGMVESTLSC